jgi:hypothetical protein
MCIRIVAPAKYARVRQVVRKEVAQPVDAVARRPCLFVVSVQTMDSDDAQIGLARRRMEQEGSVLNYWSDALIHHSQALGRDS